MMHLKKHAVILLTERRHATPNNHQRTTNDERSTNEDVKISNIQANDVRWRG